MPIGEAAAFSGDDVAQLARHLASQPYAPGQHELPRALRSLTYDQYRMIRFDRSRALWGAEGLPFQVQPFHRGFLYQQRVQLHEVSDGRAVPLRFDRSLFTYGDGNEPPADADLGYAGMRILYRLNRPALFDEVAAFVGASYFRAVGRGHSYGLSARGLAIRTADPKGEEFPWFRAFWLERPGPGATHLVVHALLDSQSVAGAWRFTLRPGDTTVMDVEARIYPRREITAVGVAPLTSMYLHGPNDRGGVDDYRPSVHDSDGLLMVNAKREHVWRPLSNPRTLQVSAFADTGPVGFGLMQRRRTYADFHDLEAAYHRRPSLWVEPLEAWGAGEVMLVEIPTNGEINDNIVGFWRPKTPLQAGAEAVLRYRLHWCTEPPIDAALAAFTSTRVGAGSSQGMRRFVLDATGGRLASLPADAPCTLDVWANGGAIHNRTIHRNGETGGLRVVFELLPGTAPAIELGARAFDHEGALTETWLYRWTA